MNILLIPPLIVMGAFLAGVFAVVYGIVIILRRDVRVIFHMRLKNVAATTAGIFCIVLGIAVLVAAAWTYHLMTLAVAPFPH